MQQQSRKYNIEVENVTKIENVTVNVNDGINAYHLLHGKKKEKNAEVMKFNSRQLIRYLKIEIAALK